MNEIFNDTLTLALGELDMQDDLLEALFKNCLTAGAKALSTSQVVEMNKGDIDVSPFLRGMKNLARIVGQVNTTLTEEQTKAVKEAVTDLIDVKDTPLLSAALEQLFSDYMDIILSGKNLRAYADNLQQG